MAIVNIQGVTNSTTGTSLAITITASGAGNLIVVSVILGATRNITSVTDSAGNTYAEAYASGAPGLRFQWYGVQTTGGSTTVTVNIDGAATGITAHVHEVDGTSFNQATVFDQTSSGSGSGTSGSVSSFTPDANGQLVEACIQFDSDVSSPVAGTNYTLGTSSGTVSNQEYYRLLSSGSETAPITWTTSVGWNAFAGTYTEAEPAGGAALFGLL